MAKCFFFLRNNVRIEVNNNCNNLFCVDILSNYWNHLMCNWELHTKFEVESFEICLLTLFENYESTWRNKCQVGNLKVSQQTKYLKNCHLIINSSIHTHINQRDSKRRNPSISTIRCHSSRLSLLHRLFARLNYALLLLLCSCRWEICWTPQTNTRTQRGNI